MKRQFKTEFHNGNIDQKPIVTMSVTVNNGKKYKGLDADGAKNLWESLYNFKHKLEAFMDEVKDINKCR